MTSPTSNSVYNAEIKGRRESLEAQRIYDYIVVCPYQESKQIAEALGIPRSNVTRALNQMSTGKYANMILDFEIKPDRFGRLVKHFFRCQKAPTRRPQDRVEDVLMRHGYTYAPFSGHFVQEGYPFFRKLLTGWQIAGCPMPGLDADNVDELMRMLGLKRRKKA